MTYKFFKIAFFVLLCAPCFCMTQSFANAHDYPLNDFEKQFEKVSNDKYYVKPASIYISSDHIFLCCQGQLIPIPHIECDEEGIYIPSCAIQWDTCPICHCPLLFGFCINSKCPTKG